MRFRVRIVAGGAFLSTVKSNVQYHLGSLDSEAGHLVTLKSF